MEQKMIEEEIKSHLKRCKKWYWKHCGMETATHGKNDWKSESSLLSEQEKLHFIFSWERFISAWNHLGEVYYGGAGFTAVQFYQIVMPSVITRRHDNNVCFNFWSSLWPYYIFAEGKCLLKTKRVKLCNWAKLYSYFAFLLLAFLSFELVLY